MIPAWISYFDCLLAITFVIAGPVGAHFGLFAAFLGFQLFLFGLLLGVLALLLGVIGLLMTRGSANLAARRRAMVGTSLGAVLAVFTVFSVTRSMQYAPINDITTDIETPPEFVKASELPANQGRNLKYDKSKYADRQKQAYADIAPLPVAGATDHPDHSRRGIHPTTFERVKSVAEKMPGWTVTYADEGSGIVEGVATSGLFRFQDDFVIAIRNKDGKQVVEMRSKSRDGIGDFGVNAARIHSFFSQLSQENEAS